MTGDLIDRLRARVAANGHPLGDAALLNEAAGALEEAADAVAGLIVRNERLREALVEALATIRDLRHEALK
jgi:predicted metal-dependent hydrolase